MNKEIRIKTIQVIFFLNLFLNYPNPYKDENYIIATDMKIAAKVP